MNSQLKTDKKTGNKYIVTHYDRILCDWDQVITAALQKHGYESGKITVVCKPKKQGGESNA